MKRILALLLASVLLTCSTWASAEPASPAWEPDHLTVAVSTPLTGDFFTDRWGNGSSDLDVRRLLFGYNLIRWDMGKGIFVPDETVVSGDPVITVNPQGDRSYTLALYPDLQYSDGTPITAWDYAFSLLLLASPALAELGAVPAQFSWLAGFDAYQRGEAATIAGVRVLADDQLRITISHEYLPYFYELYLLNCQPYPAHILAPEAQVRDDGEGIYLDGEIPAGTVGEYRAHPSVVSGPYRMLSYEDGTAELEINPAYKGDVRGNRPRIQRLTFRSLPKEELIPALQNGTVQLLNRVTGAAEIDAGLQLAGFQSTDYLRTGLSLISFCGEHPAVSDVRVRQAIALLMDQEQLVTETAGEYGKAADGYYGLGQWMRQLVTGEMPLPDGQKAADWAALNLDAVQPYEKDASAAGALLDEAGWNLNAAGEAYRPGSVRYARVDGELIPLSLTLAYAENSAAGPALERQAAVLAEAGIELRVVSVPFEELVQQYYGTADRDMDMIFMATNFNMIYDPTEEFTENEAGEHVWWKAGIADEELYARAVALRQTAPGDLLNYCARWIAFQERFMEVLPALPVYSNTYYDFYIPQLQNYQVKENITWGEAIVDAFLSD